MGNALQDDVSPASTVVSDQSSDAAAMRSGTQQSSDRCRSLARSKEDDDRIESCASAKGTETCEEECFCGTGLTLAQFGEELLMEYQKVTRIRSAVDITKTFPMFLQSLGSPARCRSAALLMELERDIRQWSHEVSDNPGYSSKADRRMDACRQLQVILDGEMAGQDEDHRLPMMTQTLPEALYAVLKSGPMTESDELALSAWRGAVTDEFVHHARTEQARGRLIDEWQRRSASTGQAFTTTEADREGSRSNGQARTRTSWLSATDVRSDGISPSGEEEGFTRLLATGDASAHGPSQDEAQKADVGIDSVSSLPVAQ